MKNYKNILRFLILIIAILYAIKCSKSGRDFEIFIYAGYKLINGLNIYKPPFIQGLYYYYSPLFALLLAPLSKLPIMIPQFCWVFFSYFLLYHIWILCTEYFDTSLLTLKQKQLWLGLSFFLALRFILFDIMCVQMTIFLLWATLKSIQLFRREQNITGAALLAFAINIKLLPLAFVCYLFYRKKIKAGLLTCAFYVLYLFLPALYLGWDKNMSLLHDWFSLINPTNKQWTIEAGFGPSSLVALIPVYLTDTVGDMAVKRNFINLDFAQVTLILNVVRLIFVLLTLAFLRTMPFKSINNKIRQFYEMSYLFIVIPLLYPHQQIYAFFYITPAFIYLTWYFITNWSTLRPGMNFFKWAAFVVVGFSFTPLIGRDIIPIKLYEIFLHYRVLPMAAILLIVILWIYRPKAELASPSF